METVPRRIPYIALFANRGRVEWPCRDSRGRTIDKSGLHYPSRAGCGTKSMSTWPGRTQDSRRKNFVNQPIVCTFEWVHESDVLQHEAVLQVLGHELPHPTRCAAVHSIASQIQVGAPSPRQAAVRSP